MEMAGHCLPTMMHLAENFKMIANHGQIKDIIMKW